MATVVYEVKPNPLEGLGRAVDILSQALQQRWQRQATLDDMTILGEVLSGKSLSPEIVAQAMNRLRTPMGAQILNQLLQKQYLEGQEIRAFPAGSLVMQGTTPLLRVPESQIPKVVGGTIFDPKTGQFVTPPMNEYQRGRLGIAQRQLELKSEYQKDKSDIARRTLEMKEKKLPHEIRKLQREKVGGSIYDWGDERFITPPMSEYQKDKSEIAREQLELRKQKLPYEIEKLQREKVGGTIFDSQTGQFIAPPMSEYQKGRLDALQREYELKKEKLPYEIDRLQRHAVGGKIFDAKTGQYITPPMSEYEKGRLDVSKQELELKKGKLDVSKEELELKKGKLDVEKQEVEMKKRKLPYEISKLKKEAEAKAAKGPEGTAGQINFWLDKLGLEMTPDNVSYVRDLIFGNKGKTPDEITLNINKLAAELYKVRAAAEFNLTDEKKQRLWEQSQKDAWTAHLSGLKSVKSSMQSKQPQKRILPPNVFADLPDPNQFPGRIIRNPATGERLMSVNGQWVRIR